MKRRNFLRFFLSTLSMNIYSSNLMNKKNTIQSNFRYIYSNKLLRDKFYLFLKNVFNLYPENEFHNLIMQESLTSDTDKNIYSNIQLKLKKLSNIFSIFQYQLPALFKQKDEMAKETFSLLSDRTTYDGYLEIGSLGRYLDYLEEMITIKGERYYSSVVVPNYSLEQMIDRGQICIGAKYIPLMNYSAKYSNTIKNNSLDLVTVYIGFHHCPLDKRTSFISSIRDVMKTGGKLVLRDHDCDTKDQKILVSLAHDVFNLGTNMSWEYNNNEFRNFSSLKETILFVENIGFKFKEKRLFQDGDPTKNALIVFTKT